MIIFTELNQADQDRAIEEIQESEHYPHDEWSESVTEDFKTILELLGYYSIITSFSGFGWQGDGASFTARYATEKRIVTKIKSYAPKDEELHRIAKELQDINRACKYNFDAKVTHSGSRYVHSNTMGVELDYYDQGQHEERFLQLSRDLADWYYIALEEEYHYMMSNESVKEYLTANEMEFDYEDN